MRPLRYSINITLDGCVDHSVGLPDPETHRHAEETLERADALIFGRVVYEMMESAFRPVSADGKKPDWMDDWMVPFARTINASKKYVVSSKLKKVDWNAELVPLDDPMGFIRRLKQQPGKGLLVGGVKLPLALAEAGLIDEYEFVLNPRIIGRGPTLLAGLSKIVDLKLVGKREFKGGAVALSYVARK